MSRRSLTPRQVEILRLSIAATAHVIMVGGGRMATQDREVTVLKVNELLRILTQAEEVLVDGPFH